MVLLEFWLGLTIRYRLSPRQRIESLSSDLVRDLSLGGSLRFDHLAFHLRLELDQATILHRIQPID